MDNDNYLTVNDLGIAEVNPTASSDIQNQFIDTYRNIQGQNTEQLGTQAHALGSDLPAHQGGLHGPSSDWISRYQTPQTEARIADLRAASQLSALTQLMANDQARMKEQYTQAGRNYNKRQRARARAAAQAALLGGNNPSNPSGNGGLNVNTNTSSPDNVNVNTNPNTSGDNIIQLGDGKYKNLKTGQVYQNAPTSFMSTSSQGMSLGVWPDGSKFTEGSTYKRGNNTYTYTKLGNMPTPSVFQIVGG